MTTLTLARRTTSAAFILVGGTLTVYLVFAILGFVSSSSEHYANFILGISAMSGLLAIRNLAEAQELNGGGGLLALKYILAIVGTILAVAGSAYIRIYANHLEVSQPFFSDVDITMGFVFTVGILLLTWIHWGWLMTSVIIASVVYLFYGHLLDSVLFMHPQYDVSFAMNYMGLGTTQGFFWLAQIATDSLYFLVIYAGVLLGLGILPMVLEVGKLSGRRIQGGAALPAIVGSGIVASVMGQSVANVVLTGRFTIPMMKEHGYRPSMAGAIEAMASTSGQIMPPILGLAGFIIASFLNIAYIDVALSALVPALLFMSGLTIGVFIYARYFDLPKLNTDVNMALVWRMMPTFVISFAVVIVMLLFYYSPSFAGLIGILVALVLSAFQGPWRPKWREIGLALDEGLVLVTILALLLIAVGPLGQIMMTTNLSGRLGSVLLQFLPESKFVMLLGAMGVSLILGMGLPTPVAYIVAALAVVPFMQQLGIPALQAHFFVFYFAVFSCLSPPVAVSVLAAAKVSKSKLMACTCDSLKLASTTFIVPFAFVYHPVLMSFPNVSWEIVPPIIEVLLIQLSLGVASYGYWGRRICAYERLAFLVVSVFGVFTMVDLLGDRSVYMAAWIASAGILLLWMKLSRGKKRLVMAG
jgi:TRAP transporter 4TM/12TM fusion protein